MTPRSAAALLGLLNWATLLAPGCSHRDEAGPPVGGAGVDTADTGDGGAPDAVSPLTGVQVEADEHIASLLTVRWHQAEEGTSAVLYMVDPGQWRSTPPLAREAGEQDQLVLGVPFDHEVRLKVVLETSHDDRYESEPVEWTTDPPPDGMPLAHVLVADKDGYDPDTPWLLGSTTSAGGGWGNNWWTFILDRKGRPVWAWESPDERVTMFARPTLDGRHILMDYDSYWGLFDEGAASEVVEIDILGQQRRRWATPGLHHSFVELPEGGIAWAGHADGVELLRTVDDEGDIRTLWACADSASGPLIFSCITNTVFLDEPTDSFLVSVVSNDTIVRVDRSTGEVIETYGGDDSDWIIDPATATFSHQHDPRITAAGTLLLSTNGVRSDLDTAVREYELDRDTRTLREVWSFGDDEGIYVEHLGTVQRLPGGNTQHGLGSAGRLREITPDRRVVWDIDWGEDNDLGRTTAFADIYALLP